MSRGRPITPKDPARIIERYLAGETANKIGSDFGYLDSAAVLKFLRDFGVQIRSREENQKLRGSENE